MPERPRLLREKSLMLPEIRNPFVHDLKLNVWDYVRISLMSVTVAPIRLILVVILLLPVWFLCFIAFVGMEKRDREKPLTGWRRALRHPILFTARLQFFCMGFHFVTVKGRQSPPEEASILAVAPHTTFFDTLIVFMTGLPSGVSRVENAEILFFGTLAKYLQPVLVRRKDPDSRQKTIAEIKQRSQSGGQWPQLVIFPEGTTTNGTCLITFKGGAFYPGVAVQPVIIRYGNKLDTHTWTWDGPGTLKVLWYTLCSFSNDFSIEFLPVYKPNPEEVRDAKPFANNVRAVMAKCLGVPVTDHTFEDCRLMEEAQQMGLPGEVGIVEFHKLLRKLGIRLENLRSHLTAYADIARSGGYIMIEDLARHLNVPVSPALQEIFDIYDRDGSGKIDFREYVIGCALVSQPANTEDTIQMAFKMFGGDKDYITRDDLFSILDNAFGMAREETDTLYDQVDTLGIDRITYDEFQAHAKKKPEYASLFTQYMEMPSSSASPEWTPEQSRSEPELSPRRPSERAKKAD